MAAELRKTGIGIVDGIPWGTHFCNFYETKKDLLDILVPYFKTGLENNEFCMWVVFPSQGKEEAKEALRRATPNVDQRLAAGDIEILSHKEWYLKDGTFDLQRVINGWLEKLKQALARGYTGMRANGNEAWLTKEDWKNFSAYEEKLNNLIANERMIVLCTYPLSWIRAAELFDVARTHRFAIAKRRGKWEVVESPRIRQAWSEMKRLNEELERRIVERTEQLEVTNERLRVEIAERKNREAELKRISRALRLVSHSNLRLVQVTDETTVLSEICRIAVEVGGYQLAWVGFAEQDEGKTVRPVAHAGFEAGYLESATITWGEGPYGHGPAGIAIRTGEPCVARNIPGHLDYGPWRNAAIQQGYVSSVSLPLRSLGRTFGVLCIYAAEEDAFDAGEIKVLLELANDLTLGLTIMRTRAERNRTEEELRVSEAKFRALSENAPAAIFIYQGDKIRYANPAVEVITGYNRQELLEMNFWDTAHPDFRDLVRERELVRQRGEPVPPRYEFKIVTKAGEERWVDFTDGKFELDGKPAVIGMALDITERKRAEEAVQESHQLLHLVLATLPVGVAVTDRAGDIVLVNAASKRIWGGMIVSGRERWAQTKGFWHDSGKRIAPTNWASVRALSEGQNSLNELIDVETYDGQEKTILNSSAPIRNTEGLIVGAVFVNEDVTERVRAEEVLKTTTEQLRALTVKLQSVREEEGRRIGRELHDEVGSAMTGLKWDLEGLGKLCSEVSDQIDCSTLRERIKGMVELTDTIRSTVQKISSELRPAILDDLGLIPAIEWQAQQFAARTGIVCQFDSSLESIDLDREKATAVFRIIQEALTNILRHSQATRVTINIEKEDDELIVEVKDNGRGITESEKAGPSSLGLMGMQERAHLIKGRIEITGLPGKGTVVTVRVPLSNEGSG